MHDDMQKFSKELNSEDVRSIKNNTFTVALNQLEACKNLAEDESIPKAPQLFELGRLKSLDVENKTIRVTDPDWPVNLMADGVFQNNYQKYWFVLAKNPLCQICSGWFHQGDEKV